MGFPDSLAGKESTSDAGDPSSIPGWEDPLEKGQAITPVFLPGESQWTEEPFPMSQRGEHD